MSFPIGSAVGGFGEGIGSGVDIAGKLAAIREAVRLRQAKAAVGQMYMNGGADPNAPQPPMPGQSSAPAGPPPMGNTSPDPMMGAGSFMPYGGIGGPPPAGPPALPTGGAPPPPQAMPPQAMPPGGPDPMMGPVNSPMATPPATDAGPGAPGPAGVGATGSPLTGAAATSGNVVKDAQGTIMSIAQQIKQANPNINPETLFDATAQHIDMMKGVRNDVRDYMMMQIDLAKQQYATQRAELRLQGVEDTSQRNYQGRVDSASIRGDAQRDVAGTQAGARIGAANIGADSRRDVAGTQAGARIGAANIGANSRENVAGTQAGARVTASQNERAGRENAAGFATGSKTPQVIAYDAQGNAVYAGGKAGPVKAPNVAAAYKSPDDVKAAFAAKKLTQQQALGILRSQFGMK